VFDWLKNRRPYNLGQQAADIIAEEIDRYMAQRVIPAARRFVGVFDETLTRLWDEPPSPPNPAGRLKFEYVDFGDNLKNFKERMRAELTVKLYKFDNFLDSGESARQGVDRYIANKLDTLTSAMLDEVEVKVTKAYAKIQQIEPEKAKKS
jgi:hypothetical protein